MAGEPERAGGSADAALPGRPPLCLARNCLTVRQFGPPKASTRTMRWFCLTARIPTGWNFRKGKASLFSGWDLQSAMHA